MRYVTVALVLLALLTANTAWANGVCCKKSADANHTTIEFATGVGIYGDCLIADKLTLSASDSAPVHPTDTCPCCPSQRDCSDCKTCAGSVPAAVLPDSPGPLNLLSSTVVNEPTGIPCTRAIARPGQPPKSIL